VLLPAHHAKKALPGTFFRLYTSLDLDCFSMNFNFSNPYTSTRLPLFARNVVSTSRPLGAQAGLRAKLIDMKKAQDFGAGQFISGRPWVFKNTS